MELQSFVDDVRDQLLTAAENSGDESRQAAERMTATIDSALRLALLAAISAATDEITLDLAPGSVEVRLRGRDPEFAVTLPAELQAPVAPTPPAVQSAPEIDESGTARITLRLSELLKLRVEEAAGREGLSVNAWLVRTLATATDATRRPQAPPPTSGQSFTGWAR
ncbi:MAG: toxin-antitoxin system HicB family antitoxin [Actinomycetes bacterium]